MLNVTPLNLLLYLYINANKVHPFAFLFDQMKPKAGTHQVDGQLAFGNIC